MPGSISHIKEYYTFSKETGIKVSADFCEYYIKTIMLSYKMEMILRALSTVSIEIGSVNELDKLLKLQKDFFQIPKDFPEIFVHKRATLTLFQLIYSFADEQFGQSDKVSKRDLFLLYCLVNDLLNDREYIDIPKPVNTKMFFSSFKIIHTSFNNYDSQATHYFFVEYYNTILTLDDKDKYEEVIRNGLKIEFHDLIKILKSLSSGSSEGIFNLIKEITSININEISTKWRDRVPKLPIPFEFGFLERYPLIKVNEDVLLTDFDNLFNSIVRSAYELLCYQDYSKFKSEFGKNIVEPVLIKLLEEMFMSDDIEIFKVSFTNIEYADFGIRYKNKIFLFEIKSSVLNQNIRFSSDYPTFIKSFNDKFVLKEGLDQQVKTLKKIDTELGLFRERTGIKNTNQLNFYPILLVFDESFQAFCTNSYLNNRFQIMKRVNDFIPQKIHLANTHSTITFNEIYSLNKLDLKPIEKLTLIETYSDQDEKSPYSLWFFLQENDLIE